MLAVGRNLISLQGETAETEWRSHCPRSFVERVTIPVARETVQKVSKSRAGEVQWVGHSNRGASLPYAMSHPEQLSCSSFCQAEDPAKDISQRS